MRYLIKVAVAFVVTILLLSGLGIVYHNTFLKVKLQNNPYTYIPGNVRDIWRGTYKNTSVILFSGNNYYGAIIYGQNMIIENSKIFNIFRTQLYLKETLTYFNVPIISIPDNSSFSFTGFSFLGQLFGQNISIASNGSQYVANPESSIMIFGSLVAIKASLNSSYYGTFINPLELLPILNDNILSFEYLHPTLQFVCSITGNVSYTSLQLHIYLNPKFNSFYAFIILGYILPANATILPLPENGVLLTINSGNSLYEFLYANFQLFMDSVV